ncbi:MAG: NADPH-dependent oxidoreductase [Planctomycetes bacterium RBG_16_59_8]|nr:MAG: NADPH-dependent oxidoreductase [Planctomycetes bacterium RBG_16_59_8]
MNVLEQIAAHRSIRTYKSDAVPDDAFRHIVESALRSSSSGNMQTFSIIATRDAERRKKLCELHFDQGMVLEAPLLLTFCADWNRMNRWCRNRDAEPGFDNFLCYMVAAGDAFIASQNSALAAESLGLGICYMGTTLCNTRKIAEFLRCPQDVIPVTTLVVGYPAEDPPTRDRLPLSAILHEEEYRDYTDRDIDRLYRQRETEGWKRYQSFPQLFKKAQEAGATNLAQIYTIAKYTQKDNVVFSRDLLALIDEKGFMNHEVR